AELFRAIHPNQVAAKLVGVLAAGACFAPYRIGIFIARMGNVVATIDKMHDTMRLVSLHVFLTAAAIMIRVRLAPKIAIDKLHAKFVGDRLALGMQWGGHGSMSLIGPVRQSSTVPRRFFISFG